MPFVPAARALSDLQLDPGASTLRVYARDALITSIPCAVAVEVRPSGRRRVVALGEVARKLRGRTPPGIEVVRPFRAGQVVDVELGAALIEAAVLAAAGARRWSRPRLLISVGPEPGTTERAAWSALGARLSAGAASFVASPIPVARALDLDATQPALLVDCGASCTRVAVVQGSEVLAATTIEIGGETMDGAVARRLARHAALAVGPETAERARLDAARSGGTTLPIHVAGRCLQRGTPRLAEVPASLLLADRGELAVAIATAVMRTLERTPVDLAPRVVASGVLLLGGVAATPGLTEPLRQTTALAWMDADPDPAAIARALRSLTQADLLDLS